MGNLCDLNTDILKGIRQVEPEILYRKEELRMMKGGSQSIRFPLIRSGTAYRDLRDSLWTRLRVSPIGSSPQFIGGKRLSILQQMSLKFIGVLRTEVNADSKVSVGRAIFAAIASRVLAGLICLFLKRATDNFDRRLKE